MPKHFFTGDYATHRTPPEDLGLFNCRGDYVHRFSTHCTSLEDLLDENPVVQITKVAPRYVAAFVPAPPAADMDAAARYGLSVPVEALSALDRRVWTAQLPGRRGMELARLSTTRQPTVAELDGRVHDLGRAWEMADWMNVPRDRLLERVTLSVRGKWIRLSRRAEHGVAAFIGLEAVGVRAEDLLRALERINREGGL